MKGYMKRCSDCDCVIEDHEDYCVGDVTGYMYCTECGDNHVSVTTVLAEDN